MSRLALYSLIFPFQIERLSKRQMRQLHDFLEFQVLLKTLLNI